MSISLILICVLLVGTVVAGYLLWHTSNQAGFKRRVQHANTSAKRVRASDSSELTPQQQQVLAASRELAARGQVRPAAQLLEQAGMRRECIALLETSGYIDEAAGILIKMQRPNRAGYIYARNGRWVQGAECFITAGLPAEAGRCLREAHRYEEAAYQYLNASKFEDAAACFIQIKRWQDAARLHLRLKQFENAASAYANLFSGSSAVSSFEFDEGEINFFISALSQGDCRQGFVDAVARYGKLTELVRSLLLNGKVQESANIYAKSAADIGPTLMSEVNLQTSEGRNLANMFMALDHSRYAGMVFERIGDFRLAAKAFERAKDYERASYCYERAGDAAKAKKLRENPDSSEVKTNSFGGSNESTVLLDSDAKKDPNTPLPLPKPAVGVFALEALSKVSNAASDTDRTLFDECNLFLELDSVQRSKIWNIGEVKNYQAEEVVIDWQQEPRGLYFILDGELACVLNANGSDVELESIDSGKTFGELWLLADKQASVRLCCKSAARVLVIDRARFNQILDQDGTIARKVYKHFTHQLLDKMLNPTKPQDLRHAS